jgi:hypothetical protein
LEWLRDFMIGRRPRVGVAGSFPEWTPVLSRILRRSVLGPVLMFIFYICDLLEDVT